MSNQQRNARVVLTYTVDQASLDYIKQSVNTVNALLENIVGANDAVGASAVEAGAKITSSFGDADLAAINNLRDSMGELADETERAGKAADDASSGGLGSLGLSGLRRTGSALTQLGAGDVGRPIQLAGDVGQVGKEISQVSDAIAATGVSAGELLVVLGPVAVAVELLAFALEAIKSNSEAAAAAEKARYTQDLQDIADLENARKKAQSETPAQNKQDTADIQQKIKDLVVLRDQLETARKAVTAQYTALGSSFDPNQRSTLGAQGQELDTEIKNADDKLKELGKQLGLSVVDVPPLIKQYQDLAATQQAAADRTAANIKQEDAEVDAAIKRYKDLLKATEDAQIKGAEDSAKTQLSINKEIATDTYTQARARLDAISQEQASNLQLIENLKALKDPTGEAAKKIDELKTANVQLVEEGTQLLASINDLPAELAARDQRLAADQKKHNDATIVADDKLAQDRANIQKKLNDTLVSDAQRLADTLAQDLTNLTQNQEDLTTGLGRDLAAEQVDEQNKALTIQINAGRKLLQLAQEHAAAMQQIRDDANAKETQDLLDRNFLGLLKDRLQTTTDLNKENTSFNSKTAQQQTDEQNQLSDLSRSIQQQRDARLLAYQQANDDAQKQYQRSNAAAEAARKQSDDRAKAVRDQALIDLSNQFLKEKAVRDAQHVQELKDDAKYGQDRLDLNAKIQSGLLAQAQSALNNINHLQEMAHGASGGSAAAHRADGGSAVPGNAYLVNDKYPGQRESVNGVPLPSSALGYYIPLQPGYVSSGSSGGATNLTIHATFTGITEQQAAMQTVKLIGKLVNHK